MAQAQALKSQEPRARACLFGRPRPTARPHAQGRPRWSVEQIHSLMCMMHDVRVVFKHVWTPTAAANSLPRKSYERQP